MHTHYIYNVKLYIYNYEKLEKSKDCILLNCESLFNGSKVKSCLILFTKMPFSVLHCHTIST